ncbi:MAG: hypothetical protein LBL26_15000 [Peptococcaceae bacterium]|jgi:hypothetical protein|nr:hypothetical protein [Peptococcaceae bacterium]
MGMSLILIPVWLTAMLLAVRAKRYVRSRIQPYRMNNLEEISHQTPLAKGLSELVAASGGIYLSIILFLDFLKLNHPEQLEMMGLTMDPLAGASMLVAVGQPMVRSVVEYMKEKKGGYGR